MKIDVIEFKFIGEGATVQVALSSKNEAVRLKEFIESQTGKPLTVEMESKPGRWLRFTHRLFSHGHWWLPIKSNRFASLPKVAKSGV